jgi:hypothetical protein
MKRLLMHPLQRLNLSTVTGLNHQDREPVLTNPAESACQPELQALSSGLSSYFLAMHRCTSLTAFKGSGIFFSIFDSTLTVGRIFIARFSELLYQANYFVPAEKLFYMFVPLRPFVTD